MNRIALLLIALAAFCSVAHANVIVNGNFESLSLNGWTTYTIANGRLSQNPTTDPIRFVPFDANGDLISSTAACFRVGQVAPYVVGQWAGGGISQTFVTGPSGLATSTLSPFSLDLDVATYLDPMSSRASNQGGLFQIFIDSLLVHSYNSGDVARGMITRRHINYVGVLNEGPHELRIEMTRQFLTGFSSPQTTTPFQFIDDIVLKATSVPEPGTTSIICAGIVMLGFMRRKTRR